MDFQDLLLRYFGKTEIEDVEPGALGAGLEHMRVDLGLTTNAGHRFALWTLMYMLGGAPDLDVAFKDPAERDAARNFMDMADRFSEE
jgi:hypothetical protein